MDLGQLNPSQRRAVTTTEGPLLVLAGAGSGKTRVITHRVAYLLEQGVPADRIVALSFTNKAAGEMRERLAKMVGPKIAGGLVLSTFHSLGVKMLREDPETFGMPGKRFSILDQGDVYGVVRSLLREHGHHGPGGDRRFDLGAIVQRISLWKNGFVEPESVQEQVVDEYDVVAASIYEGYFDRLASLGAVDFDDLVCLVARVLHHDPQAYARWSGRFDYVMVDEYQDTNSAQLRLLRGLLGPSRNLCVVGDDDQAIYGWRGADVRNILAFGEQFEGAEVIKLQENYRSRAPILEAANAVVRNNKDRHEKELVVTRGGGDPVNVVVTVDGRAEASWVGKKIRSIVIDNAVSANEVAVLYRSALLAKPIEEELQAHGIPYRVLGGQSMYDKKEVRDAQAYLKALVMPRDELAVRRALETPPRGIGRKTMELLAGYAKANRTTLMEAVHRHTSIEGIPTRSTKGLERFSGLMRRAQGRVREAGVSTALTEVFDDIAMRDHIRREVGSDQATAFRWNSVEWLLGSVGRYEERMAGNGGKPKWAEYLGKMALEGSNAAEPEERPIGKVTLATLHSSKGLEWDHVFIVGVEEGTLPHKRVSAPRASDAIAGDLDEERRLFYVGITRAREQLWLTRGAGRIDRGREVERVPSRFLEELPDTVHLYDVNQEEEITSDTMGDMATAFLSSILPPE